MVRGLIEEKDELFRGCVVGGGESACPMTRVVPLNSYSGAQLFYYLNRDFINPAVIFNLGHTSLVRTEEIVTD